MLNYNYLRYVCTYKKHYKEIFGFLKNSNIFNFKNEYLLYSTSNNKSWRVLFFGNSRFSVENIKQLNTTYREKGLLQNLEVVTNNLINPVAKYAIKEKLKIYHWPPEINDKQFDIAVVVSFGYLIPSRIIKLFPLGMINVHGSILPRWRGSAPISYSLINGDTHTGVTIMKIEPKKFDIGSIVAKKEIEIHPDETYIELEKKLSILGADLLIETMTNLPHVLNTAIPQPEEGVTYAPRISRKTSFVNWSVMTAKNVYDLQRGLDGIEPLKTYFNNEVIKLLNVKPVSEDIILNCQREKVPGLLMYDRQNRILYVSCKENTWITVGKLVLPHRKPKSAVQFSSGYLLKDKKEHLFF